MADTTKTMPITSKFWCSTGVSCTSNNSRSTGAEMIALDNEDFAVRTLTGHGMFDSVGIRFTTPAPDDGAVA